MTVSSWRGWTNPVKDHGWHDLTRYLDADVERVPTFPAPVVERFASMPDDPLNVTRIDLVVHVGTHLDAPVHFIPDGPAVHEIPIGRLCGHGVVLRLDLEPLDLITPDHLAGLTSRHKPGGMLLLDSGWAARWGTPSYHQHPSFTVEAAQWIVDAGFTLIAIDFATPDLALSERPAEFDWPVHQVLLSNGVLIVEHLDAPTALVNSRVEVVVGAAKITGADGAPARVVAREIGDPIA